MKKKNILKALKEISELMSVDANQLWQPNLGETVSAVILQDYNSAEDGEEEDIIEYSGWSEKLETLIKSLEDSLPTRMSVMVENCGHYLCNTENVESIVERLMELDDKSQELDDSLEDIVVWEKVENEFTVGQFLDQIDTYVEG